MPRSVVIDENKINELAFKLDPSQMLLDLGKSGQNPDPGGLWLGLPLNSAQAAPWSQLFAPGGPQAPGAPPPFNPQMLSMLQGMMQKQQDPKFLSGTAPAAPAKVKIDIPDISQLLNINLGQQRKPVPSIGQLLGGRNA